MISKIYNQNRIVPLNRIVITYGAFRLLRILALTGKHSLGLVGGKINTATGRITIQWVEPIKNSAIVPDHPQWSDYHEKVKELEDEGHRILGEFHIVKEGIHATERHLKDLKYHWVSGRTLIYLTVTTKHIVAYTFDGYRFQQRILQPRR